MAIAIKKVIKGLRRKHRTSIGSSLYSRPNHKQADKKPYRGQGKRR